MISEVESSSLSKKEEKNLPFNIIGIFAQEKSKIDWKQIAFLPKKSY